MIGSLFKKHHLEIFLIIIILMTAIFWRFYNFSSRWTLNQDQARDAIIAHFAIASRQLPLLGPPSSAGPFSFGPLYYWIIILLEILIPAINGPWIGFATLSVLSVVLFYFLGKVFDKSLAVIAASLAAFASLDIFNAPDMLNPMLTGFAVSLTFFSLAKLIQQKRLTFSLLLGFSTGLAVNLHLQSLSLIPLLLLAVVLNNFNLTKKILAALGITCGFLLSVTPLIYFDLSHKWTWTKSVYKYLTVGQNKFNLHYTWTDDLVNFWPNLWGSVLSNQPLLGYLFIGMLLLAIFFVFRKKLAVPKTFIIIFITFILQIIILHFYKGPRLPNYLILYHPFLIFLTSWAIWIIYKSQKYLALAILTITLIVAGYSNWQIVTRGSQIKLMQALKQNLEAKKAGPFQVYSFDNSYNISLPLFYLLQSEGKINPSGGKIGACDHLITRTADLTGYDDNCPDGDNLIVEGGQYRVFDLNKGERNLFKVTPEKIYSWLYNNYR